MGHSKLLMFWLAILPILSIYKSPFLFSWAEVLFIILFAISYNTVKSKGLFYWTKEYKLYWVYIAISFFIACTEYGYIYQAILPGGVAFFLFSIELGYCSKRLNIHLLYKYMRWMTIWAVIVLILQELWFILFGVRFSGLIPFGTLTDGLPMSDLMQTQVYADRSCSIFREPAHFAQYLLVVLALELFWKLKVKIYSHFALFVVFGLMLLKSGNGLLGLALLAVIKIWTYIRNKKGYSKYVVIMTLMLVVTLAVSYYITTSEGDKTISRISEFERDERSKSYIRIYRGYDLWIDLPSRYKLIGTNNDGIIHAIETSNISYLFTGDRESDLYFNGIQGLLLHTGCLGCLLLLFYIIPVYRESDYLQKSLLLLLLVISFVAQMFLAPTMLYSYIIAVSGYYERRIQHNRKSLIV